MTLLQTSTLSNQNLSSALLLATYTSDAERLSIIDVSLDQIEGNGDYKAYITRQRAGVGTAFVAATTTDVVASGVTNHMFGSIIVPLNNTDVLKVYALGLAGDTTTPDTIVEFWDLAIPSSTDYTSARAAKIDYLTANVATATALSTMQGNVTTILTDYARRTGDYATVTALATLQGNVTTILADYARRTGDYSTYNGIDTSGVTTLLARLTQAILFDTLGNIKSNAMVADSALVVPRVTLVDTTTNLTNAGSTVISDSDKTDIAVRAWNPAYVQSRTLSQGAESVIASVIGGDVTVYSHTTIDVTLTGLANMTGYKKIWFTAKRARENTDAESTLQLLLSNPVDGTADGLIYINRTLCDATLRAKGEIQYLSATSIRLLIEAGANTLGDEDSIYYDVKAQLSDDSVIPISEEGKFTCKLAITRDTQ